LEALMRIDLYTKTILTLIVLLLAFVALRPLFDPSTASAQPQWSGVQLMMANGALIAVDNRTGDVWAYVSMDYKGGAFAIYSPSYPHPANRRLGA
jgi:hypothetical protein